MPPINCSAPLRNVHSTFYGGMAHGGSGGGVSPGKVSVCTNEGVRLSAEAERRIKLAEAALRCAACVLAVAASALVASDREVRVFFSIQKAARFTDMKSLVFLVAANAVAAVYSLVQGGRCIWIMSRGGALRNKALAWAIFSCDQVVAYATMAAVAASLQSALISQLGLMQFQWMKTCSLYSKFCLQAGEGLACAALVVLSMVGLAGVSAFNLFRLYDHINNDRK